MLPKCSAWPASWKKARQSSAPPIGWITSITLSGTSIGEQKARGVFCGRCSMSSLMFCWLSRSIPRSASVARSAGTILSPGKPSSHCGERSRRCTSQRARSSSEIPSSARERAVHALLVELLGVGEERLALRRQLLEPEAEALVELDVGRDAERGQLAADDLDAVQVDRVQVLLGRLPHRAVELLALAAVGLVGHLRADHPEGQRLAVDGHLELGLELGELLGVLARELAEVALAAELPELADAAVAVHRRADRLHVLELRQRSRAARRCPRARACPSGPRSAGSTPRRARR